MQNFLPFFDPEDQVKDLDQSHLEATIEAAPQPVQAILLHHMSPLGGPYYRIRYLREAPSVPDLFIGNMADPAKVRGLYEKRGLLYEPAGTWSDEISFTPVGDPRDDFFAGVSELKQGNFKVASGLFQKYLDSKNYGELRAWALLYLAEMTEPRDSWAETYCHMSLAVCELPEGHLKLASIAYSKSEFAKCLALVQKGWRLVQDRIDLFPWDPEERFVRAAVEGCRSALALGKPSVALYMHGVGQTFADESDKTLESLTPEIQDAYLRHRVSKSVPLQNQLDSRFAPLSVELSQSQGMYASDQDVSVRFETEPSKESGFAIAVIFKMPPADFDHTDWLQTAGGVFVLSKADKSQILERFPFVEPKLHVVHWGCDLGLTEEPCGRVYEDWEGNASRIPEMLEAQALGKIPICVANSPCAEYVTRGFLFKGPGGGEEFESAVRKRRESLQADPKQAAQQGALVQKQVRERYSWASAAPEWADAIRSVLGQ